MMRHTRAHIRHQRERFIAKWRRFRTVFVWAPKPYKTSEWWSGWWAVEGRFPKMNSRLTGCRCACHRAMSWDKRYKRAAVKREARRIVEYD